MPNAAPSPETFFKAFGLLSHLYLTPVLGALIEGRVPDHLDAGPLPASDLAKREIFQRIGAPVSCGAPS